MAVAACGSSSKPTPDAGPPPFIVYLNFEGVTLETTTGDPDAASNTTSIVSAETVVPAYLAGVAARDTTIASIVTETKARFAPFHVEVVTDRPASLAYFMIVYTGQPSVVFGPGTGNGVSAVTQDACSNATGSSATQFLNGIGFQFQSDASSDTYTPIERGNLALPVVGLSNGIPPTKKNGDCMCFADASCGLPAAQCTIGGAGTTVDTANACTDAGTTVDEMAVLTALLGTAP
jgi:hypothetical protein